MFGRIPDGPYAGQCISNVPTDYLSAFYRQGLPEPYHTMVESELERREMIAESEGMAAARAREDAIFRDDFGLALRESFDAAPS